MFFIIALIGCGNGWLTVINGGPQEPMEIHPGDTVDLSFEVGNVGCGSAQLNAVGFDIEGLDAEETWIYDVEPVLVTEQGSFPMPATNSVDSEDTHIVSMIWLGKESSCSIDDVTPNMESVPFVAQTSQVVTFRLENTSAITPPENGTSFGIHLSSIIWEWEGADGCMADDGNDAEVVVSVLP